MRAIRPESVGDITASDPAGTNSAIAGVQPRQGNYMQTPIAVGDRLYGCTDGGVVTCFDDTVATNEMGETCMATPAITDGMLLVRTRTKLVAVGR